MFNKSGTLLCQRAHTLGVYKKTLETVDTEWKRGTQGGSERDLPFPIGKASSRGGKDVEHKAYTR